MSLLMLTSKTLILIILILSIKGAVKLNTAYVVTYDQRWG